LGSVVVAREKVRAGCSAHACAWVKSRWGGHCGSAIVPPALEPDSVSVRTLSRGFENGVLASS
jgi:hypothetical protein